jgi:hypothetical protein
VLEAAGNPDSDWTTLTWELELSLEEVRALDDEFRAHCSDVSDDEMSRALADGTPFKRFMIQVCEWESGLDCRGDPRERGATPSLALQAALSVVLLTQTLDGGAADVAVAVGVAGQSDDLAGVAGEA